MEDAGVRGAEGEGYIIVELGDVGRVEGEVVEGVAEGCIKCSSVGC